MHWREAWEFPHEITSSWRDSIKLDGLQISRHAFDDIDMTYVFDDSISYKEDWIDARNALLGDPESIALTCQTHMDVQMCKEWTGPQVHEWFTAILEHVMRLSKWPPDVMLHLRNLRKKPPIKKVMQHLRCLPDNAPRSAYLSPDH